MVGVLGRRIDVLTLEQLAALITDLPKDRPIALQFTRGPREQMFDAFLDFRSAEDEDDEEVQSVVLRDARELETLRDKGSDTDRERRKL